MFNDIDINELGKRVRIYMSESRYRHTLGVVDAAEYIGAIIMPESLTELKIAAMLHDVAKELPYDEQIALIDDYQVSVEREELRIKAAVHSFAGVALVRRDFSEFATENILSAIYNHTLGDTEMSLFDEIIFLADYIEDGRTYDSCIAVRDFIYGNISKDIDFDLNVAVLHRAVVLSCDATISKLTSINAPVSTKTEKTKTAFMKRQ